jgi:hypothetical protein
LGVRGNRIFFWKPPCEHSVGKGGGGVVGI